MKQRFETGGSSLRRTGGAILMGAWAFLASSAMANPELGGNCTACHANTSTLPAAHPPISMMDSTRCLSCHQVNRSPEPVATLSPVSAEMVGASVASQHQENEQEQEQDREQEQERTQTQRMIGNSGAPRAAHLG